MQYIGLTFIFYLHRTHVVSDAYQIKHIRLVYISTDCQLEKKRALSCASAENTPLTHQIK